MPVQARVAGPALLAVAGVFLPLLRETRETTYQFRAPFVIDSGKFEAAFGRLQPAPRPGCITAAARSGRSPTAPTPEPYVSVGS